MSAAFIEHRPRASSEDAKTTHYVIVINGQEEGNYSTQAAAKEAACKKGYRPVHVARVRHLQNRDEAAHWRKDPC